MNDRAAEAVEDGKEWFPSVAGDLEHYLIGLVGEVGELCNKYKKWDRKAGRGNRLELDPAAFRGVVEELVDAFVYAYAIAGELGIDLELEYDTKRAHNVRRFGDKPRDRNVGRAIDVRTD